MTAPVTDYEYVARHSMAKALRKNMTGTDEHGHKVYHITPGESHILYQAPGSIFVVDGSSYRLKGETLIAVTDTPRPSTKKWDTYPVPKRVKLCKLAGLSGKIGSKPWEALTLEERRALKAAVTARKNAESSPEPEADAQSYDRPKKKRKKAKRHFLMWVGTQHYTTYHEFVAEAQAVGCSKRIGHLVQDVEPGVTRVYLAHDDGIEGQGFVFGFFVVSRIELILSEKAELPDWVTEQVTRVDASVAAREDERGCGWRKSGALYLVSDTDPETLRIVAAEIGDELDSASVCGGFVLLDKPYALDSHRFRGLLRFDRESLRERRKPASDRYPKPKKRPKGWTPKQSKELRLRVKARGDDSKMKVFTLYGFETGRTRHQVVYRYNKLRVEAKRRKAARTKGQEE